MDLFRQVVRKMIELDPYVKKTLQMNALNIYSFKKSFGIQHFLLKKPSLSNLVVK